MDPNRKRAIRMTFALTSAILLASALIWTSFSAGRDELTAGQLLTREQPGRSYILAGTVGSMHQEGTGLVFTVRDPKLPESVTVDYTGIVPDPMAVGRGVLVDVTAPKTRGTVFVGQNDSLTTKCPSKYQVAPPKSTKSAIPGT
jgi:cytochrome c-type biogenesis protein CcmE